MLAPATTGGRLVVRRRFKACAVAMDGPRVRHVEFADLTARRRIRVTAPFVIDATELGDLLALGAAAFVTGAEAKAQTGEPNAPAEADPEDVQSFTYPFAIEHRPGERHPIPRPPDYDRNAREQPYTLAIGAAEGRPAAYGMFVARPGTYGPFWTYRRLIDASLFADAAYPHDIAMINWPGNDYRGGNILVPSAAEQIAHLRAAKNLSLGLLWWLQHECDRDDGGKGYPEFRLRPDVMGSADGLSKFPYIRESRRIVAVRTIVEQEITTKGPRAAHFDDSVGIGLYAIDLHQGRKARSLSFGPARPFQVPLAALIPKHTTNLLAACKNIGTTHITNGCYREHPTEWAIGEAAGATAAFCIERHLSPHDVLARRDALRTLQRRIVARGAPIMWYDDLPVADPRFEFAQMLPFELPDIRAKLQDDLHAPR